MKIEDINNLKIGDTITYNAFTKPNNVNLIHLTKNSTYIVKGIKMDDKENVTGIVIDNDKRISTSIGVGYVQMYFEKKEVKKKDNKVLHPSHYTWLKELCGIEVIDICRHLSFNKGNVVKYVLRSGHKEEEGYTIKEKELEDMKKCRVYIDDEIKKIENELEHRIIH